MSYDRDILWGRRVAWFLLVANLVAAILNFYTHRWTVAIACCIWGFNSYLVIRWAGIQQVTRDMNRVFQAGLNAMRREMEKR